MCTDEDITLSMALLGPCEVDCTRLAWREAERAGWDMSQVVATLRKPVMERLQNHQRFLAQALTLRAAFREQYGHGLGGNR